MHACVSQSCRQSFIAKGQLWNIISATVVWAQIANTPWECGVCFECERRGKGWKINGKIKQHEIKWIGTKRRINIGFIVVKPDDRTNNGTNNFLVRLNVENWSFSQRRKCKVKRVHDNWGYHFIQEQKGNSVYKKPEWKIEQTETAGAAAVAAAVYPGILPIDFRLSIHSFQVKSS